MLVSFEFCKGGVSNQGQIDYCKNSTFTYLVNLHIVFSSYLQKDSKGTLGLS